MGGSAADKRLSTPLEAIQGTTVSRRARQRVPGRHSSVRERLLRDLQSLMSQRARLEDGAILSGSSGPLGYLGSASDQIPDGARPVCFVDGAIYADAVAEAHSLLDSKPPETFTRFSDVIVFALPGEDPHGKIDRLVNAPTLGSCGRSPRGQAISYVWKDKGLDQRFGGGSRKHVLQLVDGDEGAKAALRDFTGVHMKGKIFVQKDPQDFDTVRRVQLNITKSNAQA